MKIVHVFKTEVEDCQVARDIVSFLQQRFPRCAINFDLDDCDKILRVESGQAWVEEAEIKLVLAGYGYNCEPLCD